MDFVCKLCGNTYAVHVTVALVGVATLNLALPAPPPEFLTTNIESLLPSCCFLNLINSGVATAGARGGSQSATPDSETFAKYREKEEKNQEKLGEKRKNQEEMAEIGEVLSFCPSWQMGLATLPLINGIIFCQK